jgi:hypothetical protein
MRKIYQSGNVLFLILIAISLFAALTYTITNNTRFSGNIDKEEQKLSRAVMDNYIASLNTGYLRLSMTGCSSDQINYTIPSNQTSGDKSCHIFHPDGAGVIYIDTMNCTTTGSTNDCFHPNDDYDGDGILNSDDNAIMVSNADQRDTDGDGYGNLVDADYNNDGIVDNADLTIFQAAFNSLSGSARFNEHADHNNDGVVGNTDLTILSNLFGKPPGPSNADY